MAGSRIDSAAVWARNASYPVALELIYIFQTQISQHNRGEKLYSLQQVIYYGPNLLQDPEIVRFVVGWTQFETMIEVNTSYSDIFMSRTKVIDLWDPIVVVSTSSAEPWISKSNFRSPQPR